MIQKMIKLFPAASAASLLGSRTQNYSLGVPVNNSSIVPDSYTPRPSHLFVPRLCPFLLIRTLLLPFIAHLLVFISFIYLLLSSFVIMLTLFITLLACISASSLARTFLPFRHLTISPLLLTLFLPLRSWPLYHTLPFYSTHPFIQWQFLLKLT